LTPAGVAAAPTADRSPARPSIPKLPAYIADAFRTNAEAWRFFQQLAPTHRHHFVVWIHTAEREATRAKRIRESIALLAARKSV
jgi:uncharacterized protein YdeI (YjbR/CyaY-like superfamily)